jgi:hypothetical protein
MELFFYRCSKKADLFGVTEGPHPELLPSDVCSGSWEFVSDQKVQPGDSMAGFVSRDVFRDLELRGYHLAIVRVDVRRSSDEVAVGAAITTANNVVGFFRSGRGA